MCNQLCNTAQKLANALEEIQSLEVLLNTLSEHLEGYREFAEKVRKLRKRQKGVSEGAPRGCSRTEEREIDEFLGEF